MTITIELTGNLTTMEVDVSGYFTTVISGNYWQPSEGGYFEIDSIEKDGKDITKRLSRCKGLLEDIASYIDENYND